MSTPVILLPGIGNSGPQHWQSFWEQSNPGFVRLQQRDWDNPVCHEWVEALESAVQQAGPDVILVAHSLACLVVAHWAAQTHAPIQAALLVAVPDSSGPNFPAEASGFAATPTKRFNFRSMVVISNDDPYTTPAHAVSMAEAWGSEIVNAGNCGHINSASNLGDWPEGFELLNQLRQ